MYGRKSGVCVLLIYRIMEKIMKTAEELNALKEEIETLSKKLAELTDEELKQVTGGGFQYDWRDYGDGSGGGVINEGKF